MNARQQSAKLQFYDLHGEGAKVQVMVSAASYKGAEGEAPEKAAADFEWTRDNTKRGDIIGECYSHVNNTACLSRALARCCAALRTLSSQLARLNASAVPPPLPPPLPLQV